MGQSINKSWSNKKSAINPDESTHYNWECLKMCIVSVVKQQLDEAGLNGAGRDIQSGSQMLLLCCSHYYMRRMLYLLVNSVVAKQEFRRQQRRVKLAVDNAKEEMDVYTAAADDLRGSRPRKPAIYAYERKWRDDNKCGRS